MQDQKVKNLLHKVFYAHNFSLLCIVREAWPPMAIDKYVPVMRSSQQDVKEISGANTAALARCQRSSDRGCRCYDRQLLALQLLLLLCETVSVSPAHRCALRH